MSAHHCVFARVLSLCLITVALCLSSAPASALDAITTPILTSAENFRDIAGIAAIYGGTGYVNTTSNDGVMRTGIFYRSDVLTLSVADWATISSLNIGRDIDLRTPSEIVGNPDVVPNGTLYSNVNIYGTTNVVSDPSVTVAPSVAISYMQGIYTDFVTDPVQRSGFHTALLLLATDSKADLYHCSGGKDRTGWTSMLLETIAGVSSSTILSDYLATNLYTAQFISTSLADIMANVPGANADTATALLGVQESYLEAGLAQVIASYGSLNAYLIEGLGLTQADIYVLRAKMVNYLSLPGQNGFVGNAASGAALLSSLQNSPLSGHYTSYNYYLQSAIDAGSLGGVETQVGGQVHADAASYLLRQPLWVDEAIAPYANTKDLHEGQRRVWLAGLGGNFGSEGRAGIANSTENSAGSLVGVTYRMSNQASTVLGLGYNWGSVESAGASVTVNTVMTTIGGRYGFSTLDEGAFVDTRTDVGVVDYQSRRTMGGGLGTARGSTNGATYSVQAGLGDVVRLAPFTVTPHTGFRVNGATLGSFNESGSDLALNVKSSNNLSSSVLVDLAIGLDSQRVNDWALAPDVSVGYERVLGNPQVESTGTIYGYTVNQYSAYDSHNLMKAGLGVTATQDNINIKARCNAVVGDAAKSTGISGQLSLAYSF